MANNYVNLIDPRSETSIWVEIVIHDQAIALRILHDEPSGPESPSVAETWLEHYDGRVVVQTYNETTMESFEQSPDQQIQLVADTTGITSEVVEG